MNELKFEKLLEKYKNDRFFKEVFEQRVYQPVWKLGEVDTVIDVGACAGEFSFWMAERAKHIYAIEPDPDQYKELVENIVFIEAGNIIPCNVALGGSNRIGHATVAGRGGSSLSEDATPTDRDVPVQTLATFMQEHAIDHVDVLKIDIEDGEKAVFNAEDFATVADKIDFIIGEHVAPMAGERLVELGFKLKDYPFGAIYKRI